MKVVRTVTAGIGTVLFLVGIAFAQTSEIVSSKDKAKRGDADAQFFLGVRYSEGRGVPQDYTEAVKWYRKAAEQGYAAAQYNLGVLYAKGHSVPQDFVQAYMWLNLAAALDATQKTYAEARDKVVSLMTPAQIAEAQKLAREWYAAHSKKQ